MPEELGITVSYLSNIKIFCYGDLKIFSGEWNQKVDINQTILLSVAWSGWGKVSAARASTRLISNKFRERNIEALFFLGVAGAISSKLEQGDIVISTKLVQHDIDASPLYDKYIIPSLNKKFLIADSKLVEWLFNSIQNASNKGYLDEFGNVYTGLIATGDKFISEEGDVMKLKKDFNNLLGVEMEGASVAQVAIQEKIPWQIIRVISDNANDSSPKDFQSFIKSYQNNSAKIVKTIIDNIHSAPF